MRRNNLLMEIVRSLSIGTDTLAGTIQERRIVKAILGLLEEHVGVRGKTIPIPVASWTDKGARIECNDLEVSALVLPQVLGGEVRERLIHIENIDSLERIDQRVIEDSIVLVEMPKDFDEVQSGYMYAVEKGAAAIIFYDPFPGRRRRIVVTGRWDYSLRAPAIPPIPALHVDRRTGLWLAKNCVGQHVYLEARVDLSFSTGYIVEALIEPRRSGKRSGYWEVMVTCHHDYWLTGANDNLAGVAAAILLAQRYKKEVEGAGVLRFVSFTAEEFGDPILPSWYWAYGSRWYSRLLHEANVLEDIVALLNIDVAAVSNPLIYATPELRTLLREEGLKVVGYDHSYTDSYSFAEYGLPRATAMNLEEWAPLYHTDMDTPDKLDFEGLLRINKAYMKVLRVVAEKGFEALDYREYALTVLDKAEKGGPLLLSKAYKLAIETDKALKRNDYRALAKAYRRLSSMGLRAVFDGDYRFSEGGFTVDLFPQLRVLDDYRLLSVSMNNSSSKTSYSNIVEHIAFTRVLPGSEEQTFALLPWLPPMIVEKMNEKGLAKLLDTAHNISEHIIYRAVVEAATIIEEAYRVLLRSRLALSRNEGVSN